MHSGTPISHAGIVLAAGASSRMGSAKALLQTGAGIPLAVHQASLLEQAGCSAVTIVVGSDGEFIASQLDFSSITRNPAWESGRISSLQAGLTALPDADGYLVLPVDAAGIRVSTLVHILDVAASSGVVAVRPTFQDRPGHVAWISRDCARSLLEVASSPEVKVSDHIDPVAVRVDVADPAIVHNVNTPADWGRVKPNVV